MKSTSMVEVLASSIVAESDIEAPDAAEVLDPTVAETSWVVRQP